LRRVHPLLIHNYFCPSHHVRANTDTSINKNKSSKFPLSVFSMMGSK